MIGVVILVDPVWRVRRERVVSVIWFLDVNAARRGILGVLELT